MTDGFELGRGDAVWVPTVGSPAGQIKWSVLLNGVFRTERINAVATPLDVPSHALAGFLELVRASGSVSGFSATIPHKIPLVPMMDALTTRAMRANAVNVVVKNRRTGQLTGDIIDGMGFVRSFARERIPLSGQRVMVFGAGGVARAIVASILDEGVDEVAVTDLDHARRGELASMDPERIRALSLDQAREELDMFSIVVNATPLGLAADDPLPFDPAGCAPRAVIFDCVNAPGGTLLARMAADHHRHFIDGSGMLELQLDTFLELLALRRA